MAYLGVKAPRAHSKHRDMFVRGYQAEDETLVRRASIGDQFDVVRRNLAPIALHDGPNAAVDAYHSRYAPSLKPYIQEQVAALKRPGISARASYRLNPQLYAELVDQMSLLPVLAPLPTDEARKQRANLLDGMYGVVGEVLKTELESVPYGDYELLTRRTGFIHETSPQAVIIRDENPDSFALPASPYEDETLKFDLHYYTFNGDKPVHSMWQAKADELAGRIRRRDVPRLIGGRALGNLGESEFWPDAGPMAKYRTARAIIDEVSGTANDIQVKTLDTITERLTTSLQNDQPFIAGYDYAA